MICFTKTLDDFIPARLMYARWKISIFIEGWKHQHNYNVVLAAMSSSFES
jgi:hypothetical protein